MDVERFMAYYEMTGWMSGRQPIKSWRAAVVSWHRMEQKNARHSSPSPSVGRCEVCSSAVQECQLAELERREEEERLRREEWARRDRESVSREEYLRMLERGEVVEKPP